MVMGLSELDHFLGGPLGGWAGVGWNTQPVMSNEPKEKRFRFTCAMVCRYNYIIIKHNSIVIEWSGVIVCSNVTSVTAFDLCVQCKKVVLFMPTRVFLFFFVSSEKIFVVELMFVTNELSVNANWSQNRQDFHAKVVAGTVC